MYPHPLVCTQNAGDILHLTLDTEEAEPPIFILRLSLETRILRRAPWFNTDARSEDTVAKASSVSVEGKGQIVSATYATDFNLWIKRTAQLLREHRWHEIDLEYLIEEIEGLSKSEQRSIASQLIRLLLHLLKWQYQPQRRSDSWLDSITDARTQIELAIKDSPSLKNYAEEQLEQSYQRARRQAAKQTEKPLSVFPEKCLYSIDLVLEDDWLPEKSDWCFEGFTETYYY